MKKLIKKIIISLLMFLFIIFAISFHVKLATFKMISYNYAGNKKYDYIIVLGSAVYDGKPRKMLEERLNKAIDLYDQKVAKKILMTGDHQSEDYNEVEVMKNYAIEKGVPEDDIVMDHLGVSTYDSIYRAKNIFQVKNAIIVSQKYHLYRALYIAKEYELDVYGVYADNKKNEWQLYREVREIFARDKDYLKTLFKVRSGV